MDQSPRAIMESLRLVNLLDSSQWEELSQGAIPEGMALVDDLIRRGWLTEYQGEQLRLGRGHALVLEPYMLLKPLGRGGMGQVFQAMHRRMKRIVAVKVIRADLLADPAAVRRFHREIEAVSRLSHPNIVLAYDAGEVDHNHFLVMEYVEGVDLARHLEHVGRLTPAQAMEVVRQTCLGLQHAHEQGLVHRDIKPSNLMLARRDAVVKLLDLGLARINPWSAPAPLASGPVDRLTPSGVSVGTPDYLSPEQLLDPASADIRADLYSLGCTFHHLLAGRPPFHEGNLFQKFLAHRELEPPRLESFRHDLPAGLGPLVRKLMAKRPEDRFQSPAEVVEALEESQSRAGLGTGWTEPLKLPPPPRTTAGPLSPPSGSGHDTTLDLGGRVLPREIPEDLVPLEGDDHPVPGPSPRGRLVPLQPIAEAPPPTAHHAASQLDRAWAHLRWGEPDRALEDFNEVLAEDADEPRALLGRGQAWLAMEEHRAAIDDLTRYTALSPRDSEGFHQLGMAWLAEGSSRRKAIEEFTRAIMLDPRLAQAYLHRGLAFARRRDDPRALADYDQALKLDPKLAQGWFYRGLVHDRHRRFPLAVADYSQAIELDPRHARAHNNRGFARMNLGQADEALADYLAAIGIDPNYAVAHQNLGLALADRGEYSRAITHFREATRLDPALPIRSHLAKSLLKRGQEATRRGDHPQAILDFGEAIRLEPQLAPGYVGRGVALARIGEADEALAHFNEAIRLDPQAAQAYYNRALLLARRGEVTQAQEDRQIALRLDPDLKRKGKP